MLNLGFLASASSVYTSDYWMGYLDISNSSKSSLVYDGSQYFYLASRSGNVLYVVKYDNSGSVVWSKSVTSGESDGSSSRKLGVGIVGENLIVSLTSVESLIYVYYHCFSTLTGVEVESHKISSSYSLVYSDLSVDSTNYDSFFVGYAGTSSGGNQCELGVVRGTLTDPFSSISSYTLATSASAATEMLSGVYSTSTYSYVCGHDISGDGIMARYNNSDLSRSFMYKINYSNPIVSRGISYSSSGLSIAGVFSDDSTGFPLVFVMDRGGSTTLKNAVSISSGSPLGAKYDTVGNLYVYGSLASSVGFFIVKLDSSLNIVWQRKFTNTTFPSQAMSIHDLDVSSGYVQVIFSSSASSGTIKVFVAKLPLDGSGTGNWVFNGFTINYDILNFVVNTVSATVTSLTKSSTSQSRSDSVLSVTESNQSLSLSELVYL